MKNNLFIRFTGSFTLCIAVLIAVSAFPLYKFSNPFLITGLTANLAFFYVLTIISYFIVARAVQKKGSMINAFLGGIVMKLLLAMVYLLLILKKFPGHELSFVITFFAAYLICTGFEVYYILYNLRQN